MRYISVFLFLVCASAYANPYLDCYNGCQFGEGIGDAIRAATGDQEKETRSDRDNKCRQQCIATVQSNNSLQRQYQDPTTCRPDGFGNFRCQ